MPSPPTPPPPRRRWLALGLAALTPWPAAAERPLSAWRQAIGRQDRAAVDALIAAGPDLEAADEAGWTALFFAALEDFDAAVQSLLAAGARPDARSRRGDTPLHHAGPRCQPLLLAAGAPPLARNVQDRLPRHTSRHPSAALLGAGIDARDRFGMTALRVAAFDGDDDKVAWLLAHGADPAARSSAVFEVAALPGWGAKDPEHRFERGQQPLDLVRWQHERVKWSTGRYRAALERLQAATPWRMPWR